MADHHSYGNFKRWAIALVALSFAVLLLAAFESFISSNVGETLCLILLFGVPMLVQICGVGSLDSKFTRAHEKLAKAIHDSVDRSREHTRARASAKKNQANNKTKSKEPEADEIEALERYSKFYFYTMGLCLLMYSAMWMAYGIGQHHYNWEDPKLYFNALVNMAGYWRLVLYVLSIFVLLVIASLLFLVMWMTRAVISGEVVSRHHSKQLPKFLDLYYLRLGAAQAPFLTLVFFLTVFLGVSYLFGFAFAFHDKSMPPRDPALVMRNLVIPEPSPAFPSTPSASPTPDASPIATLSFESGLSLPSKDANNNEALEAAANTIKERTREDNPVRILIVGGADLGQIESVAYQSNYELAERQGPSRLRILSLKNCPAQNQARCEMLIGYAYRNQMKEPHLLNATVEKVAINGLRRVTIET